MFDALREAANAVTEQIQSRDPSSWPWAINQLIKSTNCCFGNPGLAVRAVVSFYLELVFTPRKEGREEGG